MGLGPGCNPAVSRSFASCTVTPISGPAATERAIYVFFSPFSFCIKKRLDSTFSRLAFVCTTWGIAPGAYNYYTMDWDLFC